MNLLELVQAVTDELALDRPNSVIGSNDETTRQMLALLNRLGADLVRPFNWQKLTDQWILTTVSYNRTATVVAGSNQVTVDTSGVNSNFTLTGLGIQPFAQVTAIGDSNTLTMNMAATESGTSTIQLSQTDYPLPSDWARTLNDTAWDRTNRWPLLGPQTPQSWEQFQSGIVYAGPRERFRYNHNKLSISPPPPNGLVFSQEYISKAWIVGADGQRKVRFTLDTDSFVFEDSLLITGLKTMWKTAKGLDATFEHGEFKSILEANKSQDQGAPKLSLSPNYQSILLTNQNLPDGNWMVSP